MNRDSLETLVRVHQAELYRYVRYLGVGSIATAEDLVQETFLAALRSEGPTAVEDRQQAAWLRGIARNLFLSHCRKMKADRTRFSADMLNLAEQVWAKEFLAEGDGFDYVAALRHCLERVPEGKRKMLDMRYAEGLSRDKLAKAFRMTEDGIKAALRRVREQLAVCINQQIQGDRP
jgi:RNA polymerase sigma-70 factor, ECF subfamily